MANYSGLVVVLIALASLTSATPCGNNVRDPGRPICSGQGLCMRIVEAAYTSHVRIECYKTTDGFAKGLGTMEWVSNDPNFYSVFQRQKYLNFNNDANRRDGRCLYMDWGAVKEGRSIDSPKSFTVTCRVKSPIWTEVTGTVNSGTINVFN